MLKLLIWDKLTKFYDLEQILLEDFLKQEVELLFVFEIKEPIIELLYV